MYFFIYKIRAEKWVYSKKTFSAYRTTSLLIWKLTHAFLIESLGKSSNTTLILITSAALVLKADSNPRDYNRNWDEWSRNSNNHFKLFSEAWPSSSNSRTTVSRSSQGRLKDPTFLFKNVRFHDIILTEEAHKDHYSLRWLGFHKVWHTTCIAGKPLIALSVMQLVLA